ncbi:unnamed protein product [Bursaphelenchus xylophilus]|nr:unnamed protein product [Bursaphelenchus xylophilus]CAG9128999.1 unnamed protein product [Bursaphelenchus xylophilus]
MSSNGPKYRPLDNTEKLEVQKIIEGLFENSSNSSDFLNSEQLQLNADMFTYAEKWLACDDPNVDLPTSFPYKDDYRFSSTCHDKGHGSKQVVVIGNSHGRALIDGLKYYFRDIYDDLYVISRDLCTPFMSHTMPEHREACQKFEGVWEPLLQNWGNPIDIIIVGLQYLPDLDPIIVDWNSDEYLQAMEEFYRKMSSIAKEIVFIPMVHFNWELEPFMQILQQKLYFGKSLERFHKHFEIEDSYLRNVQRRLDRMKCKKCVKVNYREAWCHNNLCSALDSKNISYFRDTTHVTPYGSLVYGGLLRKLYDQYVGYEIVK